MSVPTAGTIKSRNWRQAVADGLPGTRISINPDAPLDKRSYRVDFSLFASLAPGHQPQTDLATSVQRLLAGLKEIGFADADFRNSNLVRLKVLGDLVAQNRLLPNLAWTSRRAATSA